MGSEPAQRGAGSPSGFRDGFGSRSLAYDVETGDPVEILTFDQRLIDTPGFASALGERVARLSRVRHTHYARVRRLDRPSEVSLRLVSDHVPGWRLSDVLTIVEREKIALEIGAVLALLRQLIPAVALFSRNQRDAAIGTIGPERLILTPHSRLVVAEYVMAPALEKLQLSRERMWRELRVVLPYAANPSRIPPSADVVGMGVVALSLLIGRLLKEDEYLVSLGELLESATETDGETTRKLTAGFSYWIARALQFDERSGLQSPQEAQLAFEEMLAKERTYVTTPTQLEHFVTRLERLAGPPPEPVGERPSTLAAPVAEATGVRLDASAGEAVSREAAASGARAQDMLSTAGQAPSTRNRWVMTALAVCAALAVAEAGVIAWLMTRSAGSTSLTQGELVVQSRPAAARVSIDGEERGMTPLTTPLAPGAHILEVRVGRSEPRVIPVEIRAGVQSGIYVELQSVATVGGLDVRSDPPNARVMVNGQFRGTTPLVLRDLPPGDHDVLVESGTRKVRQTVRVEPGITSQLVIPLGTR